MSCWCQPLPKGSFTCFIAPSAAMGEDGEVPRPHTATCPDYPDHSQEDGSADPSGTDGSSEPTATAVTAASVSEATAEVTADESRSKQPGIDGLSLISMMGNPRTEAV